MKLDGIWTTEELDARIKSLGTKADPSFRVWFSSLTMTERRYVLGVMFEEFGSIRQSMYVYPKEVLQ